MDMSGKVLSVIRNDLTQSLRDPKEVQKHLGALGILIKKPENKLVEMGNNVFLVQAKEPGKVEVSIFGNKDPQSLVQNYVNLVKYLKKIGVKTIHMFGNSQEFLQPAKAAGLNVQVKQSQQMQGNKMMPAYEYTIGV
jgi:hypothetical protein